MRILLSILVLSVCSRASAHHSFAMYDPAQLIHIVGTVKSYQWTNPHVMVWVTRDEPAGEVWTIELPTSPGNLARMNWSKSSLKPGDKVDVEVSPLRDGQHGASFKKVTLLETGEVLVASPPKDAKPDEPKKAEPEPPAAAQCGEPPPAQSAAGAPIVDRAGACSLAPPGQGGSLDALLAFLFAVAMLLLRRRARSA